MCWDLKNAKENNMSKFEVKDGHFYIDGQPQLIHAAEFHYYRTPVDEWKNRLQLIKGAGFNTLATYIPWIWHQLEEGITDCDGHSHPMRNLAGFLDMAADMGFWLIARPGPYIMAESINEGIPPWVFTNYPDAAFISQDGKTQNVVSYMHPDFLGAVKPWYKAIFEVLTPRQVTRGGRILIVQLDNEMGMIQWVRNIMDINPDTIARFAVYLRLKYSSSLMQRYPVIDLESFLVNEIRQPGEQYGLKIVEDYRYFYRGYLREYATFLWDEARLNGLEVPPVTNIHGFANGGKTFAIGISQLIDIMRLPGMLSATDVYPGIIGEGNFHELIMVNEMTKVLDEPEQPLFSMEFQCGGNDDHSNMQSSFYDLHTRLCISNGMRGINHYLFTGGENDPVLSPTKRHDWGPPIRKDGTVRRHYHRYPKLSRVLNSYGTDLVLAEPQTVTTIGFLLDQYMTEVNNPISRKASDLITHQRNDIQFDFLARGLALSHRPFSALDLDNAPLDPQQTPLIWAMMDKQCAAPTQQKIVDFLNQGGKLILVGRICIEDFEHIPCTILKDTLDISEVRTFESYVSHDITILNHKDVPVSFLETYKGNFDEVLAFTPEGEWVGFFKQVGQGQAIMIGSSLTAHKLQDLDILHQFGLKMGCRPLFTLDEWLDVRISRGKKGNFLFVANYQDDPVSTRIIYDGLTLFDGYPVSLPARRGMILPIQWQISEGITLDYATCEVTEVSDQGFELIIKTQEPEFDAQLTLTGYSCEQGSSTTMPDGRTRVILHVTDGMIVLHKG